MKTLVLSSSAFKFARNDNCFIEEFVFSKYLSKNRARPFSTYEVEVL